MYIWVCVVRVIDRKLVCIVQENIRKVSVDTKCVADGHTVLGRMFKAFYIVQRLDNRAALVLVYDIQLLC